MLTQAHAVIGANYGDEGKGRTVDALARRLGPGTVVVRANGGAQAGHTVVAGGKRHVFHHLGAGALAGAATHLSRHMVSHPMMLANEARAVAALGGAVAITADPHGFVTTPWDMMVNQAVEVARGHGRHGSCGLGFGETVGRCEDTPYPLTIADLRRPDLRDRLAAIRDQWLPARLESLGITNSPFLSHADAVLDRFVADCATFAALVAPRDDASLGEAAALVLEGAQGLLLDQRGRGFPFVTRSNTGVANMAAIAREAGIARIDAWYATRCYLTRHGRGPMADERDIAGWFTVDDPTNRTNPWQESLRFGLLDLDLLANRVRADRADGIDLSRRLAVTCLDQAHEGRVAFLSDGAVATCPVTGFGALVRERLGATSVIEGWSEASEHALRLAA